LKIFGAGLCAAATPEMVMARAVASRKPATRHAPDTSRFILYLQNLCVVIYVSSDFAAIFGHIAHLCGQVNDIIARLPGEVLPTVRLAHQST
jgi:hypothetical protein